MVTRGTGAPRLGTPTLTASDWAEAALQLVAEKGLGALTVGALAGRLGVTKGSFYWHYAGRTDLLAAALGRWEQRATTEAMTALASIDDPRRRLELMLEASTQPPRARSLYAALAEAADDPVVRRVLTRVASARIDYLEVCYRALGLSAEEAKSYAVLAYSAYRGLLQLAREAPGALPSAWPAYAALVRRTLVPPPDAGSRGRGTKATSPPRSSRGLSRRARPG